MLNAAALTTQMPIRETRKNNHKNHSLLHLVLTDIGYARDTRGFNSAVITFTAALYMNGLRVLRVPNMSLINGRIAIPKRELEINTPTGVRTVVERSVAPDALFLGLIHTALLKSYRELSSKAETATGFPLPELKPLGPSPAAEHMPIENYTYRATLRLDADGRPEID
jgi:hypothetical protein